MNVLTNGGGATTTTVGTFPHLDLADEAWLLETGVANILSMSLIIRQSDRYEVVLNRYAHTGETPTFTIADVATGKGRSPVAAGQHYRCRATSSIASRSSQARNVRVCCSVNLATRVAKPDENDWKKLGRLFAYAEATKDLPLTLEADKINVMKWYVDASFAVHPDMRSHTGAMLSLGKGCVYASSSKHKINANSSTHAELVSVSDVLPQCVWTKNFIEAQGYDVGPATIYQDNQSAIKLETDGRASSGKKTRHIDIRYFFIADVVAQGKAEVVFCPTDDMLADFFTKPLQGSKFLKFRDTILNVQGSQYNMN